MISIEDKIEALQEKSDELLKEIGRLYEEGKQKEADDLYKGEFTAISNKIQKLFNKYLSSF